MGMDTQTPESEVVASIGELNCLVHLRQNETKAKLEGEGEWRGIGSIPSVRLLTQ